MDNASDLRAALDVVALALLGRSRDQASARIATAERRAGDIDDEGQEHAEEIARSAEAEGTQSAESEVAHRLALGRREARRTVLQARQAAVERLQREALAAVKELRYQPGYPNLEDRLADLAFTVLGTDTQIDRDPGHQGGVQARAGSRTVDLTLPSIAERCMRDLGTDLEGLWK